MQSKLPKIRRPVGAKRCNLKIKGAVSKARLASLAETRTFDKTRPEIFDRIINFIILLIGGKQTVLYQWTDFYAGTYPGGH